MDERHQPDPDDPLDRGQSELRLPSERVREEARRAIEAIVLVADDPLPTQLIAQLLELSPDIVDELCHELAGEYEADGRGFQLVRVAGGWRYQTHPDQAPYVERFVLEGQPAKLSAAALETVAIVAYKQPVSRAQVAAIRGVNVDGVVRTLQQRGYIEEVARDPGPGQAVLYGTTQLFLERLGLNSVDDLPPLGDFVPSATVVEQLEQGLRPSGPAAPDRYDDFEEHGPDPEPSSDDELDADDQPDHDSAPDRYEGADDGGSLPDDDDGPDRYSLDPSAGDPDADSYPDDDTSPEP